MSEATGKLYLVPNTLDFGTPEPAPDIGDVLPQGVIRTAARLSHWVVENAKTTRAFLKRVDRSTALSRPLQDIAIVELPRAPKGRRTATAPDLSLLLAPAAQGHDIGLLSEAGLPAVADPGAALVLAAHALGIEVVALPGPSSMLLALSASGLHGQSFAFVGYLAIEGQARGAQIRELEALSRRLGQTQLMIETPYRNPALLAALVANLQAGTRLSVSCGLTLPRGFTRTDTIAAWRARPLELPANIPAAFSFLAA